MQKITSPGFAMIEVLISLGFISFILLSLLSYQISAEKDSYQNFLQTIATIQLSNFSEMLLTTTSNSAREKAFSDWNSDNQVLLPQGNGSFLQENLHDCTITVRWFSGKANTESIEGFC